MNKYVRIMALAMVFAAFDSLAWWPFGGDDDEKPRISLLMKPVNELIDQAEDRKSEGAYSESVDFYRKALNELQNVEFSNPDLVDSPSFSTVKNKRAYISAAIATLQLREASDADGLVTLSDTTELEKTIDEQKKAEEETKKKAEEEKKSAERKAEAEKLKADAVKAKSEAEKKKSADRKALVAKVPAEVGALNRFAARAMSRGETETAELALKRAIELFPESHYAYYNLAKLMKAGGAPADGIREMYTAGRMVGGPVDRELEAVAGGEGKKK